MRRGANPTILGLSAVILATLSSPVAPASGPVPEPMTVARGGLTVLTYNVEGLPGPLGWPRASSLAAISDRLRQLRSRGAQPHVVVLQEVFSARAQSIGRDAGYRWAVAGPTEAARSAAPPGESDVRFEAAASWWHGETEGKLFGSGLLVLSDYPVLRVRRMAFPDYACAGFDCLANKGAVLVTLAVPGAPAPVDVVDTHLNSRHSSHVPDQRSLVAWRRQAGFLSAFINRWHEPARPLIVAGDFNTGVAPLRRAALRREMAGWSAGAPFDDALDEVIRPLRRTGHALPPDVASILRRGSDWQFFSSGRAATIRPTAISVTFGPAAGAMLSDHIGYSAAYSFAVPNTVGPPRAQGRPHEAA